MPYSSSSSPESKPKNRDIDKKSQTQDSSKINPAPNNNKQEPVKESSEKNAEQPKNEEENKASNDSV